MMEIFAKTVKLLALNYFLKNVLSQMFGMILNMPPSYYDRICYYNTDDNTALLNSEIKVKY